MKEKGIKGRSRTGFLNSSPSFLFYFRVFFSRIGTTYKLPPSTCPCSRSKRLPTKPDHICPPLVHCQLRTLLLSTSRTSPTENQNLPVLNLNTAKMPTTQSRYQAPSYSRPVTMPGKQPSKIPVAYPSYQAAYNRAATSPPQRGASVSSSAVPSLTSDSGSNTSEYGEGASGIDLVELLNDKLSTTVNREPLDRGMASQAQT